MFDGYIKVAAATPAITVADCSGNAKRVIEQCFAAEKAGAKLVVFPELVLTGYTAGDLFYRETLLAGALSALQDVAKATEECDALIFVGLPVRADGAVYNCAAALWRGKVLGVVPKTHLPAYNEFYEKRHFRPAPETVGEVELGALGKCPFGTRLIFRCKNMPPFSVAAEICEDLWVADPPSVSHAAAGANIIVNLSASDETVGKREYRRSLVAMQSAKLVCGYVYADAGEGESTTDMVFSGHNIVSENGKILAESELFTTGLTVSEIDVSFLAYERSKITTVGRRPDGYTVVPFGASVTDVKLTRRYERTPFVPADESELAGRAELILSMQSRALKTRLERAGSGGAVVGVSGGLDSCLALLVAVRAMKLSSRPASDVTAVSMPCFGTTVRTKNNAQKLAELLGVTFMTVDITKAVERHFADIGHDSSVTDVTYENSQARERTQVLMDIANSKNALVVGTGDLSELALGWATYNGDHMSMYGVNASVPKTLVRYLVRSEAVKADAPLKRVLFDILDTPVSPELLPAKSNEIAQRTEDLVGPYELHDFFLYHFLRNGFGAGKIYRLACEVFASTYPPETVEKWLRVFIKRFFSQQFKRSCMPDGVKIGSVALSPRGDWRMPSDASQAEWVRELDERVKTNAPCGNA